MLREVSCAFKIVAFFIFILMAGCAYSPGTVKLDESTASKLRSEVQVYDAHDAAGHQYKTVKQISATVCGGREDAIDQLRYIAQSAGANGITKINCSSLLGPTLLKNCLTTSTCEAVAILSDVNKGKEKQADVTDLPEKKNEAAAVTRIHSEGRGFTLGKLPVVVTTCDTVVSADNVDIIFSGNYVTSGKVVKCDRLNNIAVISFNEFRRVPAGFRIFPSYKVRAGQKVYVMGNSRAARAGNTRADDNLTIADSIVSSTDGPGGDSRYFTVTSQNMPAAAGLPLIDLQGRVIGISTTASNPEGAHNLKTNLPMNSYAVLKSTALLDLYAETEKLVTSEDEQQLSSQELSDTYGSSVVTVTTK